MRRRLTPAASWRAFTRTPVSLIDRGFRHRALPQAAPATLTAGVFHLLVLGLVCRMMLRTGALYMTHINYGTAEGNPLGKINPGTYLIVLSMWQYLVERGEPLRQFHRQPTLAAFMAFMTIVLIYSVINRLAGYLSILADTYLCAGMVAMLPVRHRAWRRR